MRKLIAAINMTIDGICDHTFGLNQVKTIHLIILVLLLYGGCKGVLITLIMWITLKANGRVNSETNLSKGQTAVLVPAITLLAPGPTRIISSNYQRFLTEQVFL
jgi:hypothetical protein